MSFPKVKGGTHNSQSYAKKVVARDKFRKISKGKTVEQLSTTKKGL